MGKIFSGIIFLYVLIGIIVWGLLLVEVVNENSLFGLSDEINVFSMECFFLFIYRYFSIFCL